MPKIAREMGHLQVKRLAKPGLHAVGGVAGLCLDVSDTGARSWILRTTLGTRRRSIGLDPFPEVSLAHARELAADTRAKIRAGIDPVEEKHGAKRALARAQTRALTFSEAVEIYLTTKRESEFSNVKHAKQWRSTLDTYARPVLGEMAVQEISISEMLRVLQPIWETKTETASRLRGRIEAVLAWATAVGHRAGDNPAHWGGHFKELLPAPGKVAKSGNHPALSVEDAPAWFAALRLRQGIAARALEFLTLTAARSQEIRVAAWSEIDFEKKMWVVPAAHMKMRREHRVPLSDGAVALLEAQGRHQGNNLIFPGTHSAPMSDMTLSAVMRRMQNDETTAGRPGWLDPRLGRPAVPHGLRSTFRDWVAEHTDFPRDMAELALAHEVGSEVERAYRRGDMFEKRRAMMIKWDGFLTP